MTKPRPRFIPVLLLDRDRRLVKTVQFGERTYIGDPFNVIRLFNEKEVDEICLLDIDARRDGRAPDTGFVAELASECFMPLAYGGGLRDAAQCAPLARAGVEKFVLGKAAEDRALIAALAAIYGASSVVGCVDYRDGQHARALADARAIVAAGAGEIILQSIDRDGVRGGMDLDAITAAATALSVPLIALGGAGEVAHLDAAIAAGASAAASGSSFAFIGRLRAVLITYPETGIEDL